MKTKHTAKNNPLRLFALTCLPLSVPVGGFVLASCYVAQADEAGVRSELTGIALPRSAARAEGKTLPKGFGGILSEFAGQVHLPAADGPAEVFLWEGASYRPNRGAFMRTQVESALTEAGYTVTNIDKSTLSVNVFRQEYGLAMQEGNPTAFSLNPWDKFYYFHATNPQKQTTIAGLLVDSENNKHAALALARIAYAKPESDGLPEIVTNANTVMVNDRNDAMKGQPQPKIPAFSTLARRPRTARGMVKDESGNPIVGAHIVVQASAAGGFRTDVSAQTNASGVYEIPLPIGVCQVVNADCNVQYNGQTYVLPLQAVNGERKYFNAQEGGVENFVLQTYGPADPSAVSVRPEHGSNYYGGVVRLVWFHTDLPEGGTFELTLEPQGALLGSVPPRKLVFRVANKGLGEAFLNDVPIGRYTLRGKLYDKGDILPLRFKGLNSEEIGTKMQVDFVPGQSQLAALGHSGVRRFDVLIKP